MILRIALSNTINTGTDFEQVVKEIQAAIERYAQSEKTKSGLRIFAASKICGEKNGRKKVKGFEADWPRKILQRCPKISFAVIEADGARHKCFKAPKLHEPVLPTDCDLLLGVVGLDALGMKCCEENVYVMFDPYIGSLIINTYTNTVTMQRELQQLLE